MRWYRAKKEIEEFYVKGPLNVDGHWNCFLRWQEWEMVHMREHYAVNSLVTVAPNWYPDFISWVTCGHPPKMRTMGFDANMGHIGEGGFGAAIDAMGRQPTDPGFWDGILLGFTGGVPFFPWWEQTLSATLSCEGFRC